jgi:hypothetical protein
MNSTGDVDAEFTEAAVVRRVRTAVAAAVFTALLGSAPFALQSEAPWFGTWQQEIPAPPNRFEAPAYKKVTTRIEPWQDGVRVSYQMVRTRGGVTRVEWVGRFDGRDYPVQGVDYVLTNAYRVLDDRRYEIVIKVDGRPAATATAVVSPEGDRLTVTTVEQDARGQRRTSTASYRRE